MSDGHPRILILSPSPPGSGSVNEILLRDLCRLVPPDTLACLAIAKTGVTVARDWTLPSELAGMTYERLDWRHKLTYRRLPARAAQAAQIAQGLAARFVHVHQQVQSALNLGRRHRTTLVWAVLNAPPIYRLAHRVALELGVPLVTSVWDPPERLVLDYHLDVFSRRAAMAEFRSALASSQSVAVISEGMQDVFRTRYGVSSIVIRHGIPPEQCLTPVPRPLHERKLVIGFAGSIYTPTEWSILLAALDRAAWQVGGRDIRVRLFGVHGNVDVATHPMVERIGWLPSDQVVVQLSRTDVLYLPYSFDPDHEASVQQSFPTKMSTYVAAGRPILYHGPYESTPRRFFDRFPVAIACHSHDASELLSALERIVTDEAIYAAASVGCKQAIRDELGIEVMRRRFLEFIGLSTGST